jgi:hypothetical protein
LRSDFPKQDDARWRRRLSDVRTPGNVDTSLVTA